MITNNPHVKKGNVARTLLIILGVVIALYLTISSGALSAHLTPSTPVPFSKPLAIEEATTSKADGKILSPILQETGERVLGLLRVNK